MPRIVPRLLAAAMAVLSANAVVVAAEAPLPEPIGNAGTGNDQVRLRAELFRRFDADRDHRFSDREVLEMTVTMMREGRWTAAEAARETALARFDHDVDGRLDVAERREKLHARLADMAKSDRPAPREAIDRSDRNGNGTLDREELAEIEAEFEMRIAAQDSDGNGILDATEIQAAQKAKYERRGRRTKRQLPATTEREQRQHSEDFWRIVRMDPGASFPQWR